MQIGLLGAGNLARALALGLGTPVAVYDPVLERAQQLAAQTGGKAYSSAQAVSEVAEITVLCHKPAQLASVAESFDHHGRLILSALGATPLTDLREAYPHATVARIMPNIAMEVGAGLTILCSPYGAEERQLADEVATILGRVGRVVELDEAMLPLAQGVSGGMPAYVALMIEGYVDALVRQGMPQEIALDVVAGSIPGSAQLVTARGGDTLGVRRQVTSPGGTTARAIRALEAGGFREAIANAVDASIIR
ncbi:MAG: pyrroline-5-carboxylate reductase [Solirubrobacteraceae bacterium]|nr:pyrroline-5-carboxylate reductase [Solirubrobacteraceae bacterium]